MKLHVKQTKGLSFVPKSILLILTLSLILQCSWHYFSNNLQATKKELSSPPTYPVARLLSFDNTITAAKIVMLWLQAFDNQPGISIPLKELDYDRIIDWLELILQLDQDIQYPLLAAIRFYAEVPQKDKQRKMIDYVSQKFLEKPNERWPFMAHAVYIAKHRIKDLQLALECARLIRQHATDDAIPYWAKQMEIFILEDMGELESALFLIGGLIESGELTDQTQINFLKQRLKNRQGYKDGD